MSDTPAPSDPRTTTRITSKGQVTIPQAVRARHGLTPGTEVEFDDAGGVVVLRKAVPAPGRGAQRVAKVAGRRRGAGLSTDELLALTRRADGGADGAAAAGGEGR